MLQMYTNNSGKEIIHPNGEIPFPPRAILSKGEGDMKDEYFHGKIELPGKCFWCLGEWHK